MPATATVVDLHTRKQPKAKEEPTEQQQLSRQQRAVSRRSRRVTGGCMPSSTEQSLLAQSIGERLREAREMQGMSQTRAALLLGYQNSSKLAKVEAGVDSGQGGCRPSRQIPLWLLRKAARIYAVSLDWLFGITETMESDEPRLKAQEEAVWLMQCEWNRQRWRDMLVIRSVQERVEAIEGMLGLMQEQAEQAEDALRRVRELNPELWDEMAGGARLERTVSATGAAVRTAVERLVRLRREAKAHAGGAQLQLELIDG